MEIACLCVPELSLVAALRAEPHLCAEPVAVVQAGRDLGRRPLWELELEYEQPGHAGQVREAEDAHVGEPGDASHATGRQHVVHPQQQEIAFTSR